MRGERVVAFALLLAYALCAFAQSCPGISDSDRRAPIGGISAPADACFYKNISAAQCESLYQTYGGAFALTTSRCESDPTRARSVFYNSCEWPRGACGFYPKQPQAGTPAPAPRREEQPREQPTSPGGTHCADGMVPMPRSLGHCMPAGANDCGDTHYCKAGTLCSVDGRTCFPQGETDCGNGYSCRPGNVCSKGGGCIPRGETDCGNGESCPGGQVCAKSGGCMPRGATDCGGRRYCDAGLMCAKGGGCTARGSTEDGACDAAARAEAKINIDWVLTHDAPARRTFDTARSSGANFLDSLLQAQGHNPAAQASIRRCASWSVTYVTSMESRTIERERLEMELGIALFEAKEYGSAIQHFEAADRMYRAQNHFAPAELATYLARARAALQESQPRPGSRAPTQAQRGALAGALTVILSGGYEVPPASTLGGGTGTFSVATDGTITGGVITGGMKGTTAHIHRGAKGQNGPVVIPLTKSGDTYTVPEGRKLTREEMDALKAGHLYVDVHSDKYKGGEIRAQLQR